MEPFEINVLAQSYTIQPLISDNFEVYQADELIGFLTPTVRKEGTLWSSREIEKDRAQQIGESIEKHRL